MILENVATVSGKDHLGNVSGVVSDLKTATQNGEELKNDASVLAYYNYYSFGMQMPGRYFPNSPAGMGGQYRFGFNGKEKDDDINGTGATYDYGARIYDARVARFLSVDPLTSAYPWYTTYQFAGNKPIRFIDLDGLEEADPQRKAAAMDAVLAFENDKSIEGKTKMAISNLNKNEIVFYLKARLNDPSMRSHYNSCGPTSASYVSITHDPLQFVKVMLDLWKTGSAMNGKLIVPDNLRNSDKHYGYKNYDDIDQLLEGTLRYSENMFGGYLLKKPESTGNKWLDNIRLFGTNATTTGEYGDFLSRMGVTAETTSFSDITMDKVGELSKIASSGQYLVFYGYFQAMKLSAANENIGGGDHFVTVTSILQNKNGTIGVKYWHHGEYANNGYESRTYTSEQFQKAFKKYSIITNTGNK